MTRTPSPTEEENESSGPDLASTTSIEQNKRKRGQRGRNQYPERQFTINAISLAGEPIDPPQIVPRFRNAIGAIIRTKMVLDPTIPSWPLVPEGRKEAMWQLLSRTFIVPRGTREQVKHYALKMLSETFHRWKSELNTRYVKKGRTPFADYGDITPAQWEEFVRQKTTKEALALSQKQTELAKKNIHKVRLGQVGTKGRLTGGGVKKRRQ